jgi:hypothetical protein
VSVEAPSAYVATVGRVLDALEQAGIEAMVVGGLATFAWGAPRTTQDLDVSALVRGRGAEEVRAILQGLGVVPQGPFSTDFGPRFILPFREGIPVDVFLAGEERQVEFARRRRVEVAGVALWIVSPEDLVASKLRTASRFPEERHRDVEDAAGVLFHRWSDFDVAYARRRCADLGVEASFEDLRAAAEDARRRAGLDL